MGTKSSSSAVAIIGIGCRFPGGVTDVDSFWQLLSQSKDAITEIPADRIDVSHFFNPNPATPGRMSTRWGGFIEHIDEFDAGFFAMSPREAARLDPQQRLLLETAWEALEDAGQDVGRLEGTRTGVYVGQWISDFESRLFSDPEAVDFLMTTGSGRYAASGRLSYALGLRGASITVDSACSSSLAAVHLAIRSIRSGESQIALAGGANIILQPHISIAYSQSRMMAADGRCKFGDATGDGYVRSEGAAIVVLKALNRALEDGDRIYAIIRGSALNNDGRSSGSLGTPSQIGQEELLRAAYDDAGVSVEDLGYVEAHGTGTRAGDPVEIAALAAVLNNTVKPRRRVYVGSVKTNIGHTEGAAGVAGLIKAALSLYHQAIPPSLHFSAPNPAIPWGSIPCEIPRALTRWPDTDGVRFAGISAFGITGSNAHVVLERSEARPAVKSPVDSDKECLLPLSAKNPEALRALALRYAELLESQIECELYDVCWSAATRRTPLEHRAVFTALDRTAMAEGLRRFAEGEAAAAQNVARLKTHMRIAFCVPGQGAQWHGMAREMIAREPVFRAALERCDGAARKFVDWSIIDQVFAEPQSTTYRLDQIDVIQPVLVAIAIAYAELWRSLGIEPDAVVGHSMGEIGAAYIAGAFDLDEAMRTICRRSALMRRVSGRGAMALVDLSIEDTAARLAGRESQLSVAVSNSPRSSVISGDPEAVQQVMAELEQDDIFCRQISVDVASHSPQMDPLAKELADKLSGLAPATARIPLYSTVLGCRVDGPEFGASYWARNLREPVLFADTMTQMLADDIDVFVELGPHPILLHSVQQTAQSSGIGKSRRSHVDVEKSANRASMLTAFGQLWCSGYPVEWKRVMPERGTTVQLPLYPWQRERYWVEAAEIGSASSRRKRAFDPTMNRSVGSIT